MEILFKHFNGLTAKQVYQFLKLRSEVFVVEQTCIYQDMDGLDEDAYHLLFYKKTELVAYARILKPNTNYKTPSIGRVIVQQKQRKKKLGFALMEEAIKQTEQLFTTKTITISAQVYLLKFYISLGFKSIGQGYLEDGIPHVKMVRG